MLSDSTADFVFPVIRNLGFYPSYWTDFVQNLEYFNAKGVRFFTRHLPGRRRSISPHFQSRVATRSSSSVRQGLSTKRGVMIRRILATVFLALLVASPVLAQTGQINGVVTDNTGGVVPGATVKAVETATGISRDTVSGADGRYNFGSLRPATYDITAELTGFRSSQRKGVVLQANQNLTANFALELGNLSETVTVSGEAATVDVTSATISEVVDSKRIVEL